MMSDHFGEGVFNFLLEVGFVVWLSGLILRKKASLSHLSFSWNHSLWIQILFGTHLQTLVLKLLYGGYQVFCINSLVCLYL